MDRLVYSPKVQAFIKADSGLIDISDFIVSGEVSRVVNEVSTAELVIRNPNMRFTTPGLPTFRPMDAITIFLSRFQNYPVQVFTGYLDETPYLQLFPGTCTLKASCTLKRLQYTYFDPGLPYTWAFLAKYGWFPNLQTGQVQNLQAFAQQRNGSNATTGATATNNGPPLITDGSIGNILYATLNEIGKWNDGEILIEKLPESIVTTVQDLLASFEQDDNELKQEFNDFLGKLVGPTGGPGGGSTGSSAVGSAGGMGPAPKSHVTPVDVGRAMLTAGFPAEQRVLAQGMAVVNVESSFGAGPIDFTPNSAGCVGYWQIQYRTWGVPLADCNDLVKSTRHAHDHWKACSGGSFACDWYNFEASASGTAQDYRPFLSKAQRAIELGPFTS